MFYMCTWSQIAVAALGALFLVWAGAVQVAMATHHMNLGYNDNLYYPLLVSNKLFDYTVTD
jgi:hypothetical protein